MTDKRFFLVAGLLGAALATGGAASYATTIQADDNAPVRCEIAAERSGNMVQLSGLMHADHDIDGSYRFAVKSRGAGGNTDISQGSAFHAGPSGPTTLGMVMLSANRTYDVTLDVTANGQSFTCAERIG